MISLDNVALAKMKQNSNVVPFKKSTSSNLVASLNIKLHALGTSILDFHKHDLFRIIITV